MKSAFKLSGRKSGGFLMAEVAVGFAVLIIVSLMLLKLSMIVLTNRSWTVKQVLSDAYCSREVAYAKRIPFNDLTTTAIWPTYPTVQSNTVTMGKLGRDGAYVTGTLTRFKVPATKNMVSNGGGTNDANKDVINPATINSYRLQSVLTYDIHGKTYYKTRSVIRTQ